MARKPFNPFYVLLVVVGAAFAVTASAYGVTAMRALRPAARPSADAQPLRSGLADFMSRHGDRLLVGELLVLAAATVGAIATDGYWMRRTTATANNSPSTPSENEP